MIDCSLKSKIIRKQNKNKRSLKRKIKSLTEDLKESKNQVSILKNSLKTLEESFVKSQTEASMYKMKYEQLMSKKRTNGKNGLQVKKRVKMEMGWDFHKWHTTPLLLLVL